MTIPTTPAFALIHIAIKYPPLAVLAIAGYFGYPMVIDEPTAPQANVRQATGLSEQPMVALTFDDGWNTVHTSALPELQCRGMVANNDIATENFETNPYVTWDQLPNLINAGWEIGTHMACHPDLTALTNAGPFAEIGTTREELERPKSEIVVATK